MKPKGVRKCVCRFP